MYLPSYKINNSYTVYVNYVYLNDCIKAGQKQAQKKQQVAQVKQNILKLQHPKFTPLAVNTRLHHKKYGAGKVISTDKNGIMKVEFHSKVLHFIYPDAIRKGYLSIVTN